MKAIIVEDNLVVADHLSLILKKHKVEVLEIYDNAEVVIENENNKANFYFLDIRLDGEKNGIDIGHYLNSKGIEFAYLTANNEVSTLKKAVFTKPLTYITKPFKENDIVALLELFRLKNEKTTLTIRTSAGKKEIDVDDIIYCCSEGAYSTIYLKENKYLERISLNEIQEALPDHFIRAHRSFLVNANNIQSYNSKFINTAIEKIPISRLNKESIMLSIKKYST